MLFAVIGALLSDIIDSILVIIDRERYNKGKHLFWFHRPRQQEELSKKFTMFLSIILLMIALLLI